MPQKRNRVRNVGIKVIPKNDLERRLDLSPRLKEKLKPYRPKPKKFKDKEKELLDDLWKGTLESHRLGKPVKPKPKPKAKPKPPKRGDKKFKVEKPIYRGESLGKGKLSREI